MAMKFRRTLSMEDLKNASDEEMDDLLSASDTHANSYTPATSSSIQSQSHKPNMKNGTRVGPIIAPGIDSPENDDFFLHGPQAPILNLDNSDLTQEMDTHFSQNGNQNQNQPVSSGGGGNLPRSKSVRFQEPEESDRMKKVKSQVGEVTERMKDNVARLLDREASLDSLAELSDQLQYSSDIYRQSSEHLRRKIFWRQQRGRFALAAVLIIGVTLLIIPIITKLLQ